MESFYEAFLVKISWLPAELGGRKHRPSPGLYTPVSKIATEESVQSWSVQFKIFETLDMDENFALARFLFDEAPIQKIKPGYKFPIYEGPNKVAEVCCIEPPKEVSKQAFES